MKSIILCEGSTDWVLLQYFMRKTYGWEDKKTNEQPSGEHIKRIRTLTKEADTLSIGSCGGAAKILSGFDFITERNSLSQETEAYDKIVVITDRDDDKTEDKFINGIKEILGNRRIRTEKEICNNEWIPCNYTSVYGKNRSMQLLLLVIPFETTGAMETFLLKCISENDTYDAKIIQKCEKFVDHADEEQRYLNKRRYITKAKFDVYFSIRTAAEQFVQRQNILKNIEWENYIKIQKDFEKLSKLSS